MSSATSVPRMDMDIESRWGSKILSRPSLLLLLLLLIPFKIMATATRAESRFSPMSAADTASTTPIITSLIDQDSHRSLKLVSLNLAGCEPSEEAPSSWDRDQVMKAVAEELLRSDPDVLALQECPPSVEWAEVNFEGYTLMGRKASHAGYVMLLLRQELALTASTHYPQPQPQRNNDLPAVMAKIRVGPNGNSEIMVASCHLAPFEGGAEKRRSQMQDLMKTSGPDIPLIVAGDMNMRDAEDQEMEGFALVDAWKGAGSDPATHFTWDTRNHLQEGGYFNRYYGPDTRQYARRYDRIYISTPKSNSSDGTGELQRSEVVSVKSFELLANRPVTPFGRTHFLSDHFGIACEVNLK